ncbi:hypothetical protein BpHYR1_047214 [Brachionus plicatilis]|uniref:Uncharacterized protein n=1 Tax=Brachionus plicatilis TaxID=10195 RepID=A0A3M7QU14_BRAPC|nr:hypothetical protein BpHYR1_047214 [Brachionus plicatilis]
MLHSTSISHLLNIYCGDLIKYHDNSRPYQRFIKKMCKIWMNSILTTFDVKFLFYFLIDIRSHDFLRDI